METKETTIDLSKALNNHLETAGMPVAKMLSKTQGFDISLDGNGYGRYNTSAKGLAFLIKKSVSAVITAPDGTFNIHVTTSAGSDEHFDNVRTGQKVSCKLRIKGKTSISIEVRSNAHNTTLHGNLSY